MWKISDGFPFYPTYKMIWHASGSAGGRDSEIAPTIPAAREIAIRKSLLQGILNGFSFIPTYEIPWYAFEGGRGRDLEIAPTIHETGEIATSHSGGRLAKCGRFLVAFRSTQPIKMIWHDSGSIVCEVDDVGNSLAIPGF